MRAGPAFLQFDWSTAGLSMDLPVFVYSHTKTSFKFLLRQGRYRALSFHLSVNMYVFNVRSYIYCHKDKKGIKKAVTGLVSVHGRKTVWLVARLPRDEGTCRQCLVDEWPSNCPALNPSHRNLSSLVELPSSLGHKINYLLTEFSFRTLRY